MSNWRLPVWTGAIINSGVHVVMYYYFGLRMAYPGRKIWWRQYVTIIQILQFTLGFVFIAYFLKIYVLAVSVSDEGAIYSITVVRGCAVNPLVLSFFILFAQIYIRDYWANKKSGKTAATSSPALRLSSPPEDGKKFI
jgi:fatty acid elongase 3